MRTIHAIPGGIHPAENKSQSLTQAIATAGIPPLLVLPLSQHIGAPATPVVSVGDTVLKGQVIAAANGFVSVPVHAPTSGTVTAIGAHVLAHPSGLEGPCISISPDGEDRWGERTSHHNYAELDKSELLSIIRNAGIAGMGGAGFPSAVKLAGQPNKPIHTLIINGTECEPYITADDILMRERAEAILTGTHIIAHLVGATDVLIGIEDNKPEAYATMAAAAKTYGYEVLRFPTKYPSGGEKQLIQILTGQEVPAGGLPADVGLVVQNVGTAAAVYNAVLHGEPLISRITTVTGEGIANPRNYETLLGTPIEYLLAQAGFDASNTKRLIMGGPMMGFALETASVPVVKTTNCVMALSADELPDPAPQQACIRCGICVQACPASLLPQQMYWYSQAKELDKLRAHNIADCIECGACSYVCPSSIPLVQYFRSGKAAIRQADADAKEAERAKLRFEARTARLEREAAEKEAKRQARQAAAAKAREAKASDGAPEEDAVAAALARVAAKKAAQATNDDPVQAAIARAQAKRSGNAPELSTSEKLGKLETRLAKAKQRLGDATANADANINAFEAAVSKLQSQIDTLKADTATSTAPAPSDDPVHAAIERAKAARASGKTATPEEKRQKLIARLEKAKSRLAQAQADSDPNLTAFAAAVSKLEQQLADTESTPEA